MNRVRTMFRLGPRCRLTLIIASILRGIKDISCFRPRATLRLVRRTAPYKYPTVPTRFLRLRLLFLPRLHSTPLFSTFLFVSNLSLQCVSPLSSPSLLSPASPLLAPCASARTTTPPTSPARTTVPRTRLRTTASRTRLRTTAPRTRLRTTRPTPATAPPTPAPRPRAPVTSRAASATLRPQSATARPHSRAASASAPRRPASPLRSPTSSLSPQPAADVTASVASSRVLRDSSKEMHLRCG
ncbi:hypothetical protein B0H16DRAFT_788733 [Mycena metata]|uniref:Uncharacterized protein n=1 Tax=Mycena metata TaxID=1033252 RepID=A0AAD7IXK4_9AGAR|nr:hypothetical protein B0H16DRAFT_788733 [Mycena metata]